MSTNLITGYGGKAHITAEGDGAVNAALLGSGRYVLDAGEKFAYELVSNNLIKVKSGYAMDQGRKIELALNDYEELTIDNGLQGVKRCDLVVITYEKNIETGIETATMNIIKGTSGDDYTDPEYSVGDILSGETKDDFPLYRIKLNGLSVESVEKLFEVSVSAEKQTNALEQEIGDVFQRRGTFAGDIDSLRAIGKEGAYWVQPVSKGTASASSSFPFGSEDYYDLLVFVKNSTDATQIAVKYNSAGLNDFRIRMYVNGRWYPWSTQLGGYDISGIGTGTITGAIKYLNEMLATKATVTGAATTIVSSNLTANRALVSNANGKIAVSDVTAAELGYLDGVTGNVQTQLNGKAPSSHSHQYLPLSGGTVTGKVYLGEKKLYYIDAGTTTLHILELDDALAVNGQITTRGGLTVESGEINFKSLVKLANNKWYDIYNTNGTLTRLIGMNDQNNVHMGDYNGDNLSPVYLHAKGGTYYYDNATFRPNVSNKFTLGASNYLWSTVYAKTGSINTSDRTKKHDIKDLAEEYEKLFLMLQPKSFVFNDGDRVHIGAISQDVEDAMQELGIKPEEFAGFCKDIRYEYTEYNEEDGTPVESSKVPCKDEDGNIIYDYALRYQEFIFLTIHMVQKLWRRVESLENENREIKEQLQSIQQDIAELKKISA